MKCFTFDFIRVGSLHKLEENFQIEVVALLATYLRTFKVTILEPQICQGRIEEVPYIKNSFFVETVIHRTIPCSKEQIVRVCFS